MGPVRFWFLPRNRLSLDAPGGTCLWVSLVRRWHRPSPHHGTARIRSIRPSWCQTGKTTKKPAKLLSPPGLRKRSCRPSRRREVLPAPHGVAGLRCTGTYAPAPQRALPAFAAPGAIPGTTEGELPAFAAPGATPGTAKSNDGSATEVAGLHGTGSYSRHRGAGQLEPIATRRRSRDVAGRSRRMSVGTRPGIWSPSHPPAPTPRPAPQTDLPDFAVPGATPGVANGVAGLRGTWSHSRLREGSCRPLQHRELLPAPQRELPAFAALGATPGTAQRFACLRGSGSHSRHRNGGCLPSLFGTGC